MAPSNCSHKLATASYVNAYFDGAEYILISVSWTFSSFISFSSAMITFYPEHSGGEIARKYCH